jgi:hypothetical protein
VGVSEEKGVLECPKDRAKQRKELGKRRRQRKRRSREEERGGRGCRRG